MKNSSLPNIYKVTFIDSNDGTGDVIVPLPDDLLKSMSWEIGDELSIEQLNNREVVISKVVKP
ncbi:MAG: hypothetical protein PSV17_08525 [Methylotenera sp.]|uniref:hypothetical protein n=1 Tax=Methylotenera sp. TaxID=2051956 RepID=UPI0024896FA4|nr:hypothetical protein [Methylotenera sp.]MDI1309462.1 hypothetical protein [Methylotenera sp.]